MEHIPEAVLCCLRDDDGVTSIEYALLGSLIAVVIVAATIAVGVNLNSLFEAVAAAFP